MTVEDELRLSNYQKVSDIDARHEVALVKNIEDGRFYVRKKLVSFDKEVFEYLKQERFAGIPKIAEIVSVCSDTPNCNDGEQETSDHLIIIEEYISGRTLAELLNERTLSDDEASMILLSLCRILEPLHRSVPSVIHRDIKPSNVMIDDEGKVYLIDFDAGKRYDKDKDRDTVLIGTKGYAAPEQYGFGQSDPRTDIYSLGVLAGHLLQSQSGAFKEIIKKCTSMDPKDRYQSVSELAAAITNIHHKEKTPADKENATADNADYTKSWLPPGYRLRDAKSMIAASLWYAFIIYYALSPLKNDDNSSGTGRADRLFAASALLLCTLVVGNYKGIADHLPLTRSKELWKKVLGYVLYCSAIFVILAGIANAMGI